VFRTINGNRRLAGLPALAEPAIAHVEGR
jgi:hypothetical protein